MKYFVRVSLLFLFLSNVLLLCLVVFRGEVSTSVDQLKDSKYLTLVKEYAYKFNHEGDIFPLDLKLLDLEGKQVLLQDILKDSIFVLWYPQHNCQLCFQENLQQFLETAHKRPSILLSTKLNQRDLFFFRKKYNIHVPCFVVKENSLEYPFKEMTSPLFFYLDSLGRVEEILVHNPDLNLVSNAYFDKQKRK